MTLQPYNTGTIDLMPYPEHGEFCIVGVFAVDVQRRKLHYRLLNATKTKRLTGFFPEMERRVFIETLKGLHDEWEQLSQMVNAGADTELLDLKVSSGKEIFLSLTHPREGMLRQTARATILTKDIEQWLDNAFKQMVMRKELVQNPPEEQKLTCEINRLLQTWHLSSTWKRRKVGREGYHVTFPFTFQPDDADKVQRVIKPLSLCHATATKILDHGDVWLQKVRRLQHFNQAPEIIVFPVHRPDKHDAQRADHAELVVNDLKKEGVKIIEHNHLDRLREYAEVDGTEGAPLFEKNTPEHLVDS